MSEPKYYGVSTGDGNNGVSQMFPGYIVKTDDPFKLAERAARTEFGSGEEMQSWVTDNMEIDSYADVVSVTFLESKETQDERAKIESAVEILNNYDRRLARELENFTEGFGCDEAWFILEVFPIAGEEPEEHYTCPVYESIEEALGESDL